jgi:hypothetical protein
MLFRTTGVLLAFWTAACAPGAQSPWKVPSPDTADHPGAREAPASDPRTYPDAPGFGDRSKIIIEGLATNDLQNWRKGYFTGGDPGKYTFGPSMAKLLLNPQAEDVIKLQNEDRSLGEHYHFAAVNWARFYPLFGSILTPEAHKKFDEKVGRAGPYLSPSGTENHKIMEWTGASVLPWYTLSGRMSNQGKDAALKKGKEMLRDYVKKLYRAGQGEWDSSTYLMFDVNGFLNIYDFSKDPECRLLAKAGLDWFMSAYALKYTDGLYCGPNQRGHASNYAGTISDANGWLWWGGSAPVTAEQTKRFNFAMHAVTSSWRPSKVICNLARKALPLPAEQRNSKANYWHGPGRDPQPGLMPETVYLSKHYTMASLWKGFGGQMTRFQIVASGPKGGVSLTGASPVGRNDGDGSTQTNKFGDGNGMFDQTAQVGRAFLLMANIPDEPALASQGFAFFALPDGVEPLAAGDWTVVQVHKTYVAIRPIAGKAEKSTTPADKRGNSQPILKFDGRKTGFIVETADVQQYNSAREFASALDKAKLDAARFADSMEIAYTSVEGRQIAMKYQPGKGAADVSIDGKAVDLSGWPVFGGPFVKAVDGVLTVSDGQDGFVVDCTGDLPVYKALSK